MLFRSNDLGGTLSRHIASGEVVSIGTMRYQPYQQRRRHHRPWFRRDLKTCRAMLTQSDRSGCAHSSEIDAARCATAVIAEQLLAGCPGLDIVATSREPLGIPGEQIGRRDHFVDLGGTSLSALQLLIALDRAMSFKELSAHPILADQAMLIDHRVESATR